MTANASKYAPVPGKIPGRPVNLGGHVLTLAPLSLDQVQEMEPAMETLDAEGTLTERINRALPIILASLNRNYPDMTLDDLRVLVDIGNVRECVEAVVDVSGYKRAAPGEAMPAGL